MTIGFDEYQTGAKQTANPDVHPKYVLANWAMGLAGEAGETCDYLKKVVFHGHPLDVNFLKKELGDILYYVAMTAAAAGISLGEIATDNRAKLVARYPDGFSTERSIEREENRRTS